MKNFVKMVLAVVCGILLFGIISVILSMMFLGAVIASGSGQPVLPKSGVLKIDMSKVSIAEQSHEDSPLNAIQGRTTTTIGLWDAVRTINAAAADPAVKYIYLLTDGSATGIAATSEMRKSLENFRTSSGKPVVAYIESPSTASYYLASVADKVYMTANPGATTMVTGVSAQMLFFGDLLKKLGVDVQLIRHGKYKSAGEQFTRGSSSPENRAQYQRLVDSMWETMSAQIASSRGMTVEHINDCIDNLRLNLPSDFVEERFVDELVTKSDLEGKLSTLAVVDKFKDVKMMNFTDYVKAKSVPSKAKKKIAVIYADGNIVDGNAKAEVAGDRFAALISDVRADSTVKAVVLRVNSPGGSVLASDKIKTELDILKEEKPVVASYGDYAASGGYWISNNCGKIYSDAVTLTGSIGVFSMIPNLEKTAADIAHVGVETVSSNKHGDLYSLMHHFDEDEYNYMFRSVEDIYDRFTTIVSEGRGMAKEDVDAIGQGRVWTGADALGINLVDEIGTLEDAIHYAAVSAGDADLSAWAVTEYPKPLTQLEQMLDIMGKSEGLGSKAVVRSLKELRTPKIMARLPYELEIK